MNEPLVRLLVVDVDGTLIGSDLRLSGDDIVALRRLSDSGTAIAVATGRPLGSAMLLADPIPGLNYVLPANGGAVVDVESRTVLSAGPAFQRRPSPCWPRWPRNTASR